MSFMESNGQHKSVAGNSVWLQYHLGESDRYKQMNKRIMRNTAMNKAASLKRSKSAAAKPTFQKSYSALELRPGVSSVASGKATRTGSSHSNSNGIRMDDLWWVSNRQDSSYGLLRPGTSPKGQMVLPTGGIKGSGLPLIPQSNGVKPTQKQARSSSVGRRPLGKMRSDNKLSFRPQSSYSLVDSPDLDPDISGNLMFIKVNNNPEMVNVRTHYTHVHTRINLDDPLGLHLKHSPRINGSTNSVSIESGCELESIQSLDSDNGSVNTSESGAVIPNGTSLPSINGALDTKTRQESNNDIDNQKAETEHVSSDTSELLNNDAKPQSANLNSNFSGTNGEVVAAKDNNQTPCNEAESQIPEASSMSDYGDASIVSGVAEDDPSLETVSKDNPELSTVNGFHAGDKDNDTPSDPGSMVANKSLDSKQTGTDCANTESTTNKGNLSKSEYFCIKVGEDEKIDKQDDALKSKDGVDNSSEAEPKLQVILSDNMLKEEFDGSDTGDSSSDGKSKKTKRGIRFSEENNTIHEYEPWAPIDSPEASGEGGQSDEALDLNKHVEEWLAESRGSIVVRLPQDDGFDLETQDLDPDLQLGSDDLNHNKTNGNNVDEVHSEESKGDAKHDDIYINEVEPNKAEMKPNRSKQTSSVVPSNNCESIKQEEAGDTTLIAQESVNNLKTNNIDDHSAEGEHS